MEIEKLIEAIKLCGSTPSVYQCKQCAYWAGGDMSQCIPRMAADVADTLEQLQAENDRLRRERNEAVECFSGYCTSCCFEHDCAKHDMNDAAPTRWYYGDCEDWEWKGVKEE